MSSIAKAETSQAAHFKIVFINPFYMNDELQAKINIFINSNHYERIKLFFLPQLLVTKIIVISAVI